MLLISTLYRDCFGIYIVFVNMCEIFPPICLVSCYSTESVVSKNLPIVQKSHFIIMFQ
jgi:hypothetical protein